eukprot:Rhum_TRINITY_DN11931_c0_g1::Rhum_TRINITY_DN11931_c0_g1_i1::g.48022::m.48022
MTNRTLGALALCAVLVLANLASHGQVLLTTDGRVQVDDAPLADPLASLQWAVPRVTQIAPYWTRSEANDFVLAEKRAQDDVVVFAHVPTRPLCRNASELYPGQAMRIPTTDGSTPLLDWLPNKGCRLKLFSSQEGVKCLKSRKVVFYGDSTIGEMADGIAELTGLDIEVHHEGKAPLGVQFADFIYTASYMHEGAAVAHFYKVPSVYVPIPTKVLNELRTTDILVVNHGLWHNGRQHCKGIHAFYKALLRRLLHLKTLLPPGARLLLYDTRWVPTKTRIDNWWNNHPQRVGAYREAQHFAAACADVELVQSARMYRAVASFTRDGIHYEGPEVRHMTTNHFLNVVCHRDDTAPMRLSKSSCAPRQAWERWKQPLLAGCPDRQSAAVRYLQMDLPYRKKKADNMSWQSLRNAVKHLATAQLARSDKFRTSAVGPPERTPCRENWELFPGIPVVSPKAGVAWVPHSGVGGTNCTAWRFTRSEACACLQSLKIVVVGDSVSKALAEALVDAAGEGCAHSLRFVALNSTFLPWGSDWTSTIRDADVVILHHAIEDMLSVCRGPQSYAGSLRTRVRTLKGCLKPSGRLLMYELPAAFAFLRQSQNASITLNPERFAAYAEAQELVAACEEVDVILHHQISAMLPQSQANINSQGPVFNATTDGMSSNVVLNGLCKRGNHPPMRFHSYSGCRATGAMAKERWHNNVMVNLEAHC